MHQDSPQIRPDRGAGPEHRPQLDGLRFLAFFGVFLFHVHPRYAAGSLGVPAFFVLSGFLITRILLRNEGPSLASGLGTFYARRTLRIAPLYYAVLLVMQLAGRLEQPALSYFYVYNIGTWAEGRTIGEAGHFWTLSVEEQFYLVFPLVFLATPRRGRPALLILGLIASVASRHLLERFAPSPYTHMLPNVSGAYLLSGAIAGYLDVSRPGIAASPARGLLGCLLAFFVGAWISGVDLRCSWLGPVIPELIALAFTTIVWELWRARGRVTAALGWWPIAYLGKISYGLYVYHLFVIRNIAWLLHASHLDAIPGVYRARSLVALLVTIGVAMLSWHLFESPILSLKSRFGYGRAGTSSRPPRRRATTATAVSTG